MTPEELDRLWRDPRCWSPIGIYRCPADPRVVVPKRVRWAGWTLNFARPSAWWVLLGSVVLAAGPTLLVVLRGRARPVQAILTTIASVALVIALSAWEASRPRT
ncbi:MAG TPA: DUF5808 domain-containing protein [Gemmatimonadales bacterium]|jgi:hypothetical protein|nr:DUF5808 domain-containing protein [Gemmatimonadales bacterium]